MDKVNCSNCKRPVKGKNEKGTVYMCEYNHSYLDVTWYKKHNCTNKNCPLKK